MHKVVIDKASLLVSCFIVIPVSFVYGFLPFKYFEIYPDTVDDNNLLKAVMGLYLAFAILWLLGLFKAQYFKVALTSNVFFMFGLALGRALSMILDGIPSILFIFGCLGELLFGGYGLWVLRTRT
ncbi:DUF4345 domain-containing protein [Flavobacteriaceae bacterium]|jgi:hypothetical protein|nr:DUF4345 domain-containing protein [Flavobacteriaceae bacterium]